MHSTFPQQAVELFQLLVSVGAMPGEDFSVDPSTGYWHLSDRTYHLLQQAYPEVDWGADLLPLVPPDDDDAIGALHAHLGIDFVPRLLAQVRQRIQTLPLRQACWYVRQLLAGLNNAPKLTSTIASEPSSMGRVRPCWTICCGRKATPIPVGCG